MTLVGVVGLVGAFVIPGILTALIARSKGYGAGLAFGASLFSLLGMLFVLAFLPDRSGGSQPG